MAGGERDMEREKDNRIEAERKVEEDSRQEEREREREGGGFVREKKGGREKGWSSMISFMFGGICV